MIVFDVWVVENMVSGANDELGLVICDVSEASFPSDLIVGSALAEMKIRDLYDIMAAHARTLLSFRCLRALHQFR